MRKREITGRAIVNKHRVITGITLLLAAVLLAAFLLPGYLAGMQAMYPIITAKHDIQSGKSLSNEDVSLSKTSDKVLARMGFSSLDSVIGKTAARDISAGNYILQEDTSSDFTPLTIYDSIPEGHLLISISAPSLAGSVAGQLRPNDIIRVYTLDESGAAYTPPELQYIKVVAVYDTQGAELGTSDTSGGTSASALDTPVGGGNAVNLTAITRSVSEKREKHESPSLISLLVTQEQALKLVELEMSGRRYLSLVSRNDGERELKYLEHQRKVLDGMARGNEG
jgi:pilus assembly protein CpaB